MIARLLPLLRQSLLREAMPPLSLGQIHVFPKTLKKCLNTIPKLKHNATQVLTDFEHSLPFFSVCVPIHKVINVKKKNN